MLFFASAICFVASHAGPADHFATFAEKLIEDGADVCVYGSGPAYERFQERGLDQVILFDASDHEGLVADEMAEGVSAVITDVGHPFSEKLLRALPHHVKKLAYYDNPEPFVPGGYSDVAAKVMSAAQRVLFANANLVSEPFGVETQDRVGVGYYPLERADAILQRRKEGQEEARRMTLEKYGIVDERQKVFAYFGGNNEHYFQSAFPAFLSFLSSEQDLSKVVIFVQQHPGAKGAGIDKRALEKWLEGTNARAPKVIFSQETTDDLLVAIDGALYSQTSMTPLFPLAKIQAIQVGKEVMSDLLLRGGLAHVVTSQEEFGEALLKDQSTHEGRTTVFKSLGIKENWHEILKKGLI